MEQNNNTNRNNRSFKIVTVIALCVAVLCLSVAYATLSQDLEINGTANVEPKSWQVVFDDITTDKSSNDVTVSVTPTGNVTAITNLSVKLKKPGDWGSLKVKAKNTGGIDAILDSFDNNDGVFTCDTTAKGEPNESHDRNLICGTGDNNSGAAIKLTVTYDSKDVTTGITSLESTNKKLPATTGSKDIEVKVEYLQSAEDIPTDSVTVNLPDLTFNYVQDFTTE